MTRYKKVTYWLIATMLLIWVLLTDSPYQKGGIGPLFTLVVPTFVMLIAILIGLLYNNFRLLERLIISLVFGIAGLFVVSFIITPYIVNLLYGDKTWFLWEAKHRIFINFLYYSLNAAFLTGFIHLYRQIRQKVVKQKINRPN